MSRNIRRALLTVGLTGTIMLMGCPRPQEIHLFNNAGHDLRVHYTNGVEVAWRAGTLLKLADAQMNMLRWLLRSDRRYSYPVVDVVSDMQRYEYHIDRDGLLPHNNLVIGGVVIAPLQLEPDGALYAVTPTGTWPAKVADPQPPGCPVKPQASP